MEAHVSSTALTLSRRQCMTSPAASQTATHLQVERDNRRLPTTCPAGTRWQLELYSCDPGVPQLQRHSMATR